MIDAADMVVGLKVTVEDLGTLTLAEPVGSCPHTCEAPLEVDFPATSEVVNRDGIVISPAQPARKEWIQPERQIRTAVRDGKRVVATTAGKARDSVERWTALDEKGILRVVDCRFCELVP